MSYWMAFIGGGTVVHSITGPTAHMTACGKFIRTDTKKILTEEEAEGKKCRVCEKRRKKVQ